MAECFRNTHPEWRNRISLEKRDLSLRSKESTNNIIAHVSIKILFNGECLSEIKSEFTKNHACFERECFQQIHEKIEPKILEVLDQLLGVSENVNLPYFEKIWIHSAYSRVESHQCYSNYHNAFAIDLFPLADGQATGFRSPGVQNLSNNIPK